VQELVALVVVELALRVAQTQLVAPPIRAAVAAAVAQRHQQVVLAS